MYACCSSNGKTGIPAQPLSSSIGKRATADLSSLTDGFRCHTGGEERVIKKHLVIETADPFQIFPAPLGPWSPCFPKDRPKYSKTPMIAKWQKDRSDTE